MKLHSHAQVSRLAFANRRTHLKIYVHVCQFMLHICNCDPPAHCESLSKIKGFYLALSGNKVTTLDANANVNASVVTHFISLRRSASSNLVTSASSAMMRSGSAHNHQRQCMRVENRSEFAHFTTDFHEASFYVNLKALRYQYRKCILDLFCLFV